MRFPVVVSGVFAGKAVAGCSVQASLFVVEGSDTECLTVDSFAFPHVALSESAESVSLVVGSVLL